MDLTADYIITFNIYRCYKNSDVFTSKNEVKFLFAGRNNIKTERVSSLSKRKKDKALWPRSTRGLELPHNEFDRRLELIKFDAYFT